MRATLAVPAFTVLLAALLSLPATALAGPPQSPARSGPYSVELTDERGRVLPTWQHEGRTYVLGQRGDRYLVRVRNGSPRRAEVVVSVDGRDVLDGQPSAVGKRGYLVEAWGEATIDGFRLSQEAVAAFRFSSVSRSYAAQMGDARDVGVIGVAVFPERIQPPPPPRPRPCAWWRRGPCGVPGAEEDESSMRRSEQPPSPPSAAPAAPSRSRADTSDDLGSSAGGAAPREGLAQNELQAEKKADRRPGLGTEFGEQHDSHVREVPFERASSQPQAVLALRYDDRRGLLALGIDVDGCGTCDEAALRQSADPFRRDAYARPPPGWRQ
jgi:hypothetical protein